MYIEASDYSKKTECDSLDRLDIAEFNKAGMLNTGGSWICKCNSGFIVKISVFLSEINSYITIKHKIEEVGEIKDFEIKIPLVSTPCNLSGKRYWFACRMVRNGFCCSRKVRVLFRVDNYFACRHCHRLTYESQNRGMFHEDSFIAKPQSEIEQFDAETADDIYELTDSESVFRKQKRELLALTNKENNKKGKSDAAIPIIYTSPRELIEFPEWEL